MRVRSSASAAWPAACMVLAFGMPAAGLVASPACGPALPADVPALAPDAGSPGLWSSVASGTFADLHDIAFGSAKRGWAVGAGVILGTHDGGATWAVEHTDGTLFSALAVQDAQHAWALGVDHTIAGTKDDGATWTTLDPGGWIMNQQGLDFTGGVGWVAGQDAIFTPNVFRSPDGGATWERAAPLPLNGHEAALYDVAAFDGGALAVGARWDGRGIVARSLDGGATWCVRDDLPAPLSSVAMQGTVGYAAGFGALGSGTLLRTVDGGASWVAVPGLSLRGLHDVAMRDAQAAVAVGEGGSVVGTDTGGVVWAPEHAPTLERLRGAAFQPGEAAGQPWVAWAVGDEGTVLRRG